MRPPQLLKIAAVAEKPQARVIFHFDGTIITVELSQSVECVCVCVCVFIKLHITTQSGPVILVILCHSH